MLEQFWICFQCDVDIRVGTSKFVTFPIVHSFYYKSNKSYMFFHCFLKGDFKAPIIISFRYYIQKLQGIQLFYGDILKLFLQQLVHIDLSDVYYESIWSTSSLKALDASTLNYNIDIWLHLLTSNDITLWVFRKFVLSWGVEYTRYRLANLLYMCLKGIHSSSFEGFVM